MILALTVHLAATLSGHAGLTPVPVQAAGPWWVCVVDYEGTRYFSDVFAGDGPDTVYAAIFGRFVEDGYSGHFRPAECQPHASLAEGAAGLRDELAAGGTHARETGWTP